MAVSSTSLFLLACAVIHDTSETSFWNTLYVIERDKSNLASILDYIFNDPSQTSDQERPGPGGQGRRGNSPYGGFSGIKFDTNEVKLIFYRFLMMPFVCRLDSS